MKRYLNPSSSALGVSGLSNSVTMPPIPCRRRKGATAGSPWQRSGCGAPASLPRTSQLNRGYSIVASTLEGSRVFLASAGRVEAALRLAVPRTRSTLFRGGTDNLRRGMFTPTRCLAQSCSEGTPISWAAGVELGWGSCRSSRRAAHRLAARWPICRRGCPPARLPVWAIRPLRSEGAANTERGGAQRHRRQRWEGSSEGAGGAVGRSPVGEGGFVRPSGCSSVDAPRWPSCLVVAITGAAQVRSSGAHADAAGSRTGNRGDCI